VTIFWVADKLNELVLREEMTSWPAEAVVLHAKAFGCIRDLLYGVTAERRSAPCALGQAEGRAHNFALATGVCSRLLDWRAPGVGRDRTSTQSAALASNPRPERKAPASSILSS